MPCVTAPPLPRFEAREIIRMLSGGMLTAVFGFGVQGPEVGRGCAGRRWVRVKCSATARVRSVLPSSMRRISQPLGMESS